MIIYYFYFNLKVNSDCYNNNYKNDTWETLD